MHRSDKLCTLSLAQIESHVQKSLNLALEALLCHYNELICIGGVGVRQSRRLPRQKKPRQHSVTPLKNATERAALGERNKLNGI